MSVAGVISRMARHVPDAPAERAVAVQTADALACFALASPMHEAQQIAEFFGTTYGPSDTSCAATAAAIIRMSEGDPIHIPSCLNSAAIVVPVALAHAQDGDSFSRAIHVGTTLGLWIAQSVGGVRALERGVWPTLLAAPAIAAATAAAARGFDAERAEHAVALALAGSSGRLGRPSAGSPSGRWLAIGEATARGVRATEAAHRGFLGDRSLPNLHWLGAQGAGDIADIKPDLSAVSQIGLKPFIAARQGMNALVAFDAIRGEFDSRDIECIVIELPPECLPVINRPLNLADRLSRIANLAYRISASAVERNCLFDPTGCVEDEDLVLTVAARTRVGPSELDTPSAAWPARVRVRARGRWHEAACIACPGDAGDPEGQEKVLDQKVVRLGGSLRDPLDELRNAQGNDTVLRHARDVFGKLFQSFGSAAPRNGAVGMPCGVE